MDSLIDILKHNPNAQMSYQVGFCLWLLTFEQEVAEQIQKCVPQRIITLTLADTNVV